MTKICHTIEIIEAKPSILIVEIPVAELEKMETKGVVQAHTLKLDNLGFRYYLARCKPVDGETHRVYVDAWLPPGEWKGIHKYAPFEVEDDLTQKAPWEDEK